ncbi:hypothetical protein Cs7R123_40420 [Catellatospora sp. TT07R-123]|uniref:hypothetical protein n=1 Tax=Catellatospora sp. TT07R-123 TaxID=2733863 RepID=UPI001B1742C4|nr:hypothetical protein [Catellatospora sp. TT07R-123]GHJ46700.1 hypothetical protein Cs7R123_40420 [Catellatospora sp. TT07R-123]
MSYAIRRRAAAFAAAGLLAGLPLLLASPAGAAEPEAAPNVDFTGGGLGVLLCGSKPTTMKITVAAESKVKLTNGLGQKATLQIDGKDSAAVSDGETIEVQFHRGPVKVAMVPECLLNLNPSFEPLTVDVAARTTQPTGTTPTTGSTPNPSRSSGSTSGSSSSTKPSKSRDSHSSSHGSSANSSEPAPSGDDTAIPEVPKDIFNPDDEQPGADPSPSSAVVVGEGSGNSGPMQEASFPVDNGPIGLLAIIATVCVVGVGAGAIRAIIAQRATRAEFA